MFFLILVTELMFGSIGILSKDGWVTELAGFEYTYFDNKSFLRTNWKFQGNIKFIKLCSTRVAQLYQ